MTGRAAARAGTRGSQQLDVVALHQTSEGREEKSSGQLGREGGRDSPRGGVGMEGSRVSAQRGVHFDRWLYLRRVQIRSTLSFLLVCQRKRMVSLPRVALERGKQFVSPLAVLVWMARLFNGLVMF